MRRENENSIVSKKIQDTVRKLIAEEYYAYKLYLQACFAVVPEDRCVIADMFKTIAKDELDDHLKTLADWCFEYGIDIPCCDSEFKKLAAADISKQVEKLKKKQNAEYYIKEAIKSEMAAIASYKEALETKGICEFTDLQSALWKIYYEEEEHLRDLHTAEITYNAEIAFGM